MGRRTGRAQDCSASHTEGVSPRRSNLGAMSVSTEVQRTLVKSPPELWAELSNPEALARHLGEFGEIRITKADPETKVEWEAEQAKGVVQLKQSGWGTKVTLSVTRTPAMPEPPLELEPTIVAEPEPVAVQPEPVAVQSEPVAVQPKPVAVESEPAAVELEPVAVQPEPEPIVEPEPVAEPELVAVVAEQETVTETDTRPGFFARLFRRGHARRRALAEALAEFDAVTEPEPKPEIEVVALAAPEPIYPERPVEPELEVAEPAEDLASELESLEEQMAAETTELLTGVLDRLGAAHHRPFSRG